MFADAIKIIRKATFPIFRVTPLGHNQENRACVGTGFFVSDSGIFVTVAHVFDATAVGAYHIFWGYIPDSINNPPLKITEIARDDAKDICVCQVALKTPDFLKLSPDLAPVGRSVCTVGYPLPSISWDAAAQAWVLGNVRRYVQPSFVMDNQWVMAVSNAQGVSRKHEGFLVRDIGLYGMSGGPVFDTSANVLGVFASVSDPRKSTNGTATIEVQNGCAISSDRILKFIQDKQIKI